MSRNQLRFFIRDLRRRRSWSQAQLAEIADVSLRTIQRLENSGRCAHETLLAVAAAFDVDVQDFTRFLPDEGEPREDEQIESRFWLAKLMMIAEVPMIRNTLYAVAAFTTLLAVLIAGHSFFTLQAEWNLLVGQLAVCLLIVGTGALTFLRRQASTLRQSADWLVLAGGIALLAVGAAATVWTYFQGKLTGDFEYWIMLVEMALVTQGGLTILYMVGGRRLAS